MRLPLSLALFACQTTTEATAPATPPPVAPVPDAEAATTTPVPATSPGAAAATSPAIVLTGARPKNVLMLSIDTVRKDHIGRYGAKKDTPFLDGLFKEGLVLDRHRSCSDWTLPSVMCALSGKDGIGLGVFAEVTVDRPEVAPAQVDFLPEILARHGYWTARFTTNQFLGERFGVGTLDELVEETRIDAQEVVAKGVPMIDRAVASGKPWFVHLHFIDPHTPYNFHSKPDPRPQPGDPDHYAWNPRRVEDAEWAKWTEQQKSELQKDVAERYTDEIGNVDGQLASLWKTLEKKGLLEDTLVVVWSDHGEQFWERGEVTHGYDIHDEESGAIGAFWARSLKPHAFEGNTVHEDLVPTTLEILGFGSELQADGFTGVVVGTAPADRATFTAVLTGQDTKQSVDQYHKRLIYDWEGRLSFYDLDADPKETNDLLGALAKTDPADPAFPADAKTLWALLLPKVAALDALYPTITPVPPGAEPTAEQKAAPRGFPTGSPDEMAHGSREGGGTKAGSGGRGSGSGGGRTRR